MDGFLDNRITDIINTHFHDFLEDWKTLIKIPSIKSAPIGEKIYGEGCAKALEAVLGMAECFGFVTRNLNYQCGYAEYGEGEETVAVFAHLDIVPFGNGWTVDPLGAEIINGKLYGRGAGDNKVACISSLYALFALKEAGIPLKRKIRIVFGCDEESGMEDMQYYLKNEGEPYFGLVPDASYPVNYAEKGIIRGQFDKIITSDTMIKKLQGGERCNIVPGEVTALLSIGEKIPNNLEDVTFEKTEDGMLLTAHGKTCHAACPEDGKNGIGLMAKALIKILPETDGAYEALRTIADKIGLDPYGKELKISCEDEATGALTFNIGIIELKDNKISFIYDIRNPATLDCEKTIKTLNRELDSTGFVETQREISYPMYLPPDHILVETVKDIYNKLTGENLSPTTMGGGTYARNFKRAVACGIAKMKNIHTADEHVDIASAKEGCRILAHSLFQLSNL